MPQNWTLWIWIGLGAITVLVALAYALLAFIGSYVVNGMSRMSFQLASDSESQSFQEQAQRHLDTAWLAEQGFEPAGCYKLISPITTIDIIGWKHVGTAVFYCCYLFPDNVSGDFVSILSDGNGVTTGCKADGLMIPTVPGSWIQVFPGKTLQERWDLHLEAETNITQTTGASPAEHCRSLSEEMEDAAAKQLGYIHEIPLWQLRIPFWYIFRCRRLVNKTVAQQMLC